MAEAAGDVNAGNRNQGEAEVVEVQQSLPVEVKVSAGLNSTCVCVQKSGTQIIGFVLGKSYPIVSLSCPETNRRIDVIA